MVVVGWRFEWLWLVGGLDGCGWLEVWMVVVGWRVEWLWLVGGLDGCGWLEG